MIDSFDNAFILDRMFGHDIDVFNNAVLCEVNFGFGSNIPISPHPQNMQLSLEFQTFCKVLNPPKRWKRDTWDSVYICIIKNIYIMSKHSVQNKSIVKTINHTAFTPCCKISVPLQSNHICNITVQRPADTQQRFHADMLALAHVGDHICSQTGGKP